MAKYAAVDIGSNSMRLLVAEVGEDGAVKRLAEDRQVTRLGESVFAKGVLSEEAIRLAEDVLLRFRGIIAGFGVERLRAVATSATRDAGNQAEFVTRSQAALGARIETISGVEEARLIGLGVEAVWPQGDEPVLIVDVGGGSAEFLLTKRGAMVEGYSRPLGAVRLTEVFLEKGPPRREQVHRLQEFIDEKLEIVVRRLGGQPFVRAIATSASAAAIVCAVNGISRTERQEADCKSASLEQVRKLYRDLSTMTVAERRAIPGIGPRRAEIVLAGAAVYVRTMERFDIASLHYSTAGVREGIIADLAQREEEGERLGLSAEQKRVIEIFAKKFNVSLGHARASANAAMRLFEDLQSLHKLGRECARLLEASCYLLDVGHYVSDTGHHKHSYYLVANADLAAFTDTEKRMIALLCRYHRKSLPQARHVELAGISSADRRALELMVPFVRIADALDRSRDQHVKLAKAEIRGEEVALTLEAVEGKDDELEKWAIERNADAFTQVYGKKLRVTRPV